MFIIFSKIMLVYRLYKLLRERYTKFRPMLKDLIDDPDASWDDKLMGTADKIFFYDGEK
jgi:hypothetical protein